MITTSTAAHLRRLEREFHATPTSEESCRNYIVACLAENRLTEAAKAYRLHADRLAMQGQIPSVAMQEYETWLLPAAGRSSIEPLKRASLLWAVPLVLTIGVTALLFASRLSQAPAPRTSSPVLTERVETPPFGDAERWAQAGQRLMTEGTALYHKGDYSGALDRQFAAQSLFERAHSPGGLADSWTHIADLYQERGDLKRAHEAYLRVLEARNNEQEPLVRANLLEIMGTLNTRLGRPESAAQLQESLQIRQAKGDKMGVALCHLALGTLALSQEDTKQAEAFLQSAVQEFTALKQSDALAAARLEQAQLESLQGHLEAADTDSGYALHYWQQKHHTRWTAFALRCRSVWAQASGKPVEAERLARESIRLYEEVGDRYGEAQAQLALCAALSRPEVPSERKALLAEVETYARSQEILPLLNRVSALSR